MVLTLKRMARCRQKPMDRSPMGTMTHFCCFLSCLLTAFLLMYRSPSSDLNAPLQKKRKESSRVRRCPSSRNAMNCKVYYSSVAMDLDLAHAECMGARCRWYFVSSVDPLLPSEATHGRRDHARARRDTASARAPTGDRDAILTPCGRRRGRRGGGRGRA
jgi:hypothetical protein